MEFLDQTVLVLLGIAAGLIGVKIYRMAETIEEKALGAVCVVAALILIVMIVRF